MNDANLAIETIFNAAKALPAADQKVYLDLACKDNAALRNDVERLLGAAVSADSFFEEKPLGLTVLEDTVSDSPVRERAGARIGRYKLLQQIGEGGMGVVYMAEQEEPVRRRVALKIIKLGMDTKHVVARFEAERQALALMDHRNIARVLDGGATDTGRPYFVMELVQGVPITEFCDKARLSTKDRLQLFIQVCQAIQSAHQKGIIHRDIKPSNVLVTLHDGVPVPKVIDFGIAKATNQKLTEKTLFTNFASMIGTPAYMSPEQAEISGLDIDTRTDIYASGVLLYALLTGTTPFPEKRLRSLAYGEMQRVIVEEEPERPSTRLSTMAEEQKTLVARNCGEDLDSLGNRLKGDLDWIVMKCLEKDRARRYETANDLAADLKRCLDNEPVVARPPSMVYRLQKALRRHRLLVATGSAVAVSLLAGIIVSSWQASVAIRARTEAETARGAERSQRLAAQVERDKALTAQREAQRNMHVVNMSLIQRAWEQNNLTQVPGLLEASAAYPGRGFEWYYWQRQMHLASRTLRGHLHFGVSSVVFSPDGQRIVNGGGDQTAKVWDLETGRELLTLTGHGGSIDCVAFSPDSRRLFIGGEGRAEVWQAASPQQVEALRLEETTAAALLEKRRREQVDSLKHRCPGSPKRRDPVPKVQIVPPLCAGNSSPRVT